MEADTLALQQRIQELERENERLQKQLGRQSEIIKAVQQAVR